MLKLGFIGAGNMGSAILRGLIAAEYLSADGIHLSEAGVEAAAQQTAQAIRALLAEETEEANKESSERRDNDEACRITW